MRLITRTPVSTADPVTATDLADHLRVEAVEAIGAMRYAQAAALEIEQHAALALLTQEIVAETCGAPGTVIALPIGPVQAGAAVAVELIEPDGSTTAINSGFHLIFGRHPELHFDEAPTGPIRATYEAGFGAAAEDIPRDLALAVLDQALRLYDRRGDMDNSPGLAPSTARICARYRRVTMGA